MSFVIIVKSAFDSTQHQLKGKLRHSLDPNSVACIEKPLESTVTSVINLIWHKIFLNSRSGEDKGCSTNNDYLY